MKFKQYLHSLNALVHAKISLANILNPIDLILIKKDRVINNKKILSDLKLNKNVNYYFLQKNHIRDREMDIALTKLLKRII